MRSGLLTDVQLFEDYPETYWTDVSRRHRWIRGDWQIATWGLPFAPDGKNKLRRNYISSLSKWKIWDNIKRSLLTPAMLVLLALIWLLLPNPGFWMIGFVIFWFLCPWLQMLYSSSENLKILTQDRILLKWQTLLKRA
ncbi:hypothetical protein KRR40_18820 [Niabella defluvii]|nr:hypothetical protein KRR40_18820 [Niabella sp. I65]